MISHAKRAERKKSGLCVQCGKERALSTRLSCEKCLEYWRLHSKTPRMRKYFQARNRTPEHRLYQQLYDALLHRTTKWRAGRRARDHKREALLRGDSGSWTAAQFEVLCVAVGHRCTCCGKRRKLHADHIIPVSKGGRNIIENIQPLCHSCNESKNDKICKYECICGRQHRNATIRIEFLL
jgi:5-methylcytosine-specific restriction endonuclease McrA